MSTNISEQKTRRQKLEQLLRDRPSPTPAELQDALKDSDIKISRDVIVEEIKEIHESLDCSILVAPPVCLDCSFQDFDDIANIPSQCPQCKSNWVDEPEFTIKEGDLE